MTTLLTVPQAAARLGFDRRHVYRLINSGRLKAVRLGPGCHWRIPESAIDQLIAMMDTSTPTARRYGSARVTQTR